MTKLLIDRFELQDTLGIGKSKVFELIRTGDLKPVKIGGALRFRVADVEAFVEGLRAAA